MNMIKKYILPRQRHEYDSIQYHTNKRAGEPAGLLYIRINPLPLWFFDHFHGSSARRRGVAESRGEAKGAARCVELHQETKNVFYFFYILTFKQSFYLLDRITQSGPKLKIPGHMTV